MTFERTAQVEDRCRAGVGGENHMLSLALIVAPAEVDNSPLFSFVAYDVTPGTTGSFSPDVVSVLATGAIWSRLIPDPEMPVECTLNLTSYELVSETERRVAGSVSCLSALSGIGEAGSTPLTLEAWTFSVLLERGSGD